MAAPPADAYRPEGDRDDIEAFLAGLPPDLKALIAAGTLAFEIDALGGYVCVYPLRPGATFKIK